MPHRRFAERAGVGTGPYTATVISSISQYPNISKKGAVKKVPAKKQAVPKGTACKNIL